MGESCQGLQGRMGWSRSSTSAAHLEFSQARINDPVSWGAPQNHRSKVGVGLCSHSSGGFEGAPCWGPALPGGSAGQTDTSLAINSCWVGGISPLRLLAWWHGWDVAPARWHTLSGVRTASGNAGASGILGQGSGGSHLAAEQGGRMWLGETLVSPAALP